MRKLFRFLSIAILVAPLAAFAADMPAGVGTKTAKLAANALLPSVISDATVLTDAKGHTLYVLASDVEFGKSACNGDCAFNWPPFIATADAAPVGEWTIFTRDDGKRQWAFKGRPLYTFAKDQAADDAKGHNVLEIWTAVTVGPGGTQSAAK